MKQLVTIIYFSITGILLCITIMFEYWHYILSYYAGCVHSRTCKSSVSYFFTETTTVQDSDGIIKHRLMPISPTFYNVTLINK